MEDCEAGCVDAMERDSLSKEVLLFSRELGVRECPKWGERKARNWMQLGLRKERTCRSLKTVRRGSLKAPPEARGN